MLTIPERYSINTTAFLHYWQEGTGKALLAKSGITPDIKNTEVLIPLLFETDTLGDKVAEELYFTNGFQSGFKTISSYLENGVPEADSENIHQLFSQFENRPEWVDETLLETGAALCRRCGLTAFNVLRDYSLMGGYESPAINKPLIFTGVLKKGAIKRLSETVEFWVNITGEGAMKQGNIGFTSTIHTRMIHSYSRLSILKTGTWESQKWGAPLNAWDMIATNLGFSIVFLVGLRKMGFEPTTTEIQGLFHFWKYVGYLLGIPVEHLPATEEQAIESLYYWTMTQGAGDEDSVALALALSNEPIQVNFPKYRWMRKLVKEMHLAYNYHLLGTYSCESLQLPKSRFSLPVKVAIRINKKWQRQALKSTANYQQQTLKGRNDQVRVSTIYRNSIQAKNEH